MVRFSDRQIVSDIASARQSLQARAMAKYQSDFQLIAPTHAKFICHPLELNFFISDGDAASNQHTFEISLNSLIVGQHYLLGPTVNEIVVKENCDWATLAKRMTEIDQIAPRAWATWLSVCLGLPRVNPTNVVRSGLEDVANGFAETTTIALKLADSLSTRGDFQRCYADVIRSSFQDLWTPKTQQGAPKLFGFEPFYDLFALGEKAFKLFVDGTQLGIVADDDTLTQLFWR